MQYYGAQEGRAHLNSVQCSSSDKPRLSLCTKETLINQTGCSTLGGYAYLVCRGERSFRHAVQSLSVVHLSVCLLQYAFRYSYFCTGNVCIN